MESREERGIPKETVKRIIRDTNPRYRVSDGGAEALKQYLSKIGLIIGRCAVIEAQKRGKATVNADDVRTASKNFKKHGMKQYLDDAI